MVVKVLVVDDSGFFRRRVSEILSADPNIQVVGTATNGREAIDQAQALRPDVITMDYEMPRRCPCHAGCTGRRGGGFPAEELRRHLAQPGEGQATVVREGAQHRTQQSAQHQCGAAAVCHQ